MQAAVLDELADAASVEVLNIVIAKAEAGEPWAARLLLQRCWPMRAGRPVELPGLQNSSDLPAALGAVRAAMASGEITPTEAAAIASVLEIERRVVELEEVVKRLERLERAAPTIDGRLVYHRALGNA